VGSPAGVYLEVGVGCHLFGGGVGVGDGGEAGLGEDVEAEVAPALGPVVVLLGQDGADGADQGVAVGEDTDHIGAAADLAIQPFLWVVGPDLSPQFFGERGEREDVGAGGLEVVDDRGEFVGKSVQDPVELLVHRVFVGLVVDRMQQRLHPGPGRFRGDGHEVGGVVGAAALPARAGQGRADRGDEAGVGVAGDKADTGQATRGQVAQESQPASRRRLRPKLLAGQGFRGARHRSHRSRPGRGR